MDVIGPRNDAKLLKIIFLERIPVSVRAIVRVSKKLFLIVSGTYDVQLGEHRPQFGQERRKKNRTLPTQRTFSSCPEPISPRIQSRREDGEGALSRHCSPCHARACGPAHLQPYPFPFSPPAPQTHRCSPPLLVRPINHDSSSCCRSTREDLHFMFDVLQLADHLLQVGIGCWQVSS